MKEQKCYWVDLPDPLARDENAGYINVATFPKLREAIEFLSERYGMPRKVAGFFISRGAV